MHPYLFHIGSFRLGTYGVLLALGVFFAVRLAEKRGRSVGWKPGEATDLALVAMVGAFLGAKILMIIGDWDTFRMAPWDYLKVNLRSFGAFYGGFLGGTAAGLWWLRRRGFSFWAAADVVAPAIALAQALGRLGCFMAGCCYGKACALPWAVTFADRDSIAPTGVALHPVQLYEAAGCLLLFFALSALWKRRAPPGTVFAAYVGGYAALRFAVEFFRGDDVRGLWFGGRMSTSQVIALPLIAVAVWMYVHRRKSPPAVPDAESSTGKERGVHHEA